MNIDLAIKIAPIVITLAGGIVTIWRANKELFWGSKSGLREEYKFAKAFFDDIDKQPDMHPYARQKGLQAIAGNQSLPSTLIEYLLTLHNPASVLKEYVFARNLLDHFPTARREQISFKKRYKKAFHRKVWKAIYLTTYWISYLWAVSPIFALQWLHISIDESIFFLFFTLPFLAVTIFSVRANIRIKRAESLVKNQQTLHSVMAKQIKLPYRQPGAS